MAKDHEISNRSHHLIDEEQDLERIQSEVEDYDSNREEGTQYKISCFPADFTLQVLCQKWKDKDIRIPEFQRQYVWNQVQASRLIESFLIGLPIPAIFLYTESESKVQLVIDGQQRLRSIVYFFEGYFGEPVGEKRRVFRLKGLNNPEYDGKAYADLDEAAQRTLRNSVLRSFIVQQSSPDDDTSVFHIFERLNTGGTLLSNQEIRNCVYHGPMVKLLQELNRLPDWRKIYGKNAANNRQHDVELVLRFLALRDKANEYRKPMKDFLSRYLSEQKSFSEGKQAEVKKIFEVTCSSLIEVLGEKPFHLHRALASPVFDAIMVAFSHNLDCIPPNISERYESLKQNEDFQKCIDTGTTDVEIVHKRLKLAKEVLFEG